MTQTICFHKSDPSLRIGIFLLFCLWALAASAHSGASDRSITPPGTKFRGYQNSNDLATELNSEKQILGVGHHLVLRIPARVPIAVSNGKVIRLKDLGNEIQITGLRSGNADITFANRTMQVVVLSAGKFKLFQKIAKLTQNMRGPKINAEAGPSGGKVIIEGRLLRLRDWQEIAAAANSLGQDYEFRANIEPAIRTQCKTFFDQLIQDSSLPELNLQLHPQARITLPTKPDDLRERASAVMRPFGFAIETSVSSLALEPSVRVKLIIAEINKSKARQFGARWNQPGSASIAQAQLLPELNAPSGAGLNIDINALEQTGIGKVLASPTLLCRSGKEADFLAGGEFPIKTSTQYASSVAWKKYGVMMHLKPNADYSGRMSIGISTEVSMMDTAHSVDGVPGLLVNHMETHFDLSRTRTIILSGLLKEEWGRSSEGLPLLSQLPILGALFGSQDYRNNKTELVVFVTPSVAHPGEEEE